MRHETRPFLVANVYGSCSSCCYSQANSPVAKSLNDARIVKQSAQDTLRTPLGHHHPNRKHTCVAIARSLYRAPKPRNLKMHIKDRKMPFWTPQKRGPSIKIAEKSINMSKDSQFFCHFDGAIFLGFQNGILRTLKYTFEVLGFRGSVGGLGDCNTCAFLCFAILNSIISEHHRSDLDTHTSPLSQELIS